MFAELSKIQAAICGLPFQSRNKELRVMTIVCAVITYTSVSLRFISRLFLAQTYGMDDWFILAAAVSSVLPFVSRTSAYEGKSRYQTPCSLIMACCVSASSAFIPFRE
jgi:hypothetical protein